MLKQHRPDQLLRLRTVRRLHCAPRSTPETERHARQHNRQLHVDVGLGVLARVAVFEVERPTSHGSMGRVDCHPALMALRCSGWRCPSSPRRRVPTEVIDLIWPDSCRNGQPPSQPARTARTQRRPARYQPLTSRLPSSLALSTWAHVEVLNAAAFHDPCVEANSKHTSEACWPGSTVDHGHGSCKQGGLYHKR